MSILLGSVFSTLQAEETNADARSYATATTEPTVENVILISIDGLRGEEVFGGADRRLLLPELGVKEPDAATKIYCPESREERREYLMPFLWSQVAAGGWIAGDVEQDSLVSITNGHYFSYPGYSEILCGFADERVNSNNKKYNESVTVLEWLHQQPDFKDSVLAFTSWDVFPYIINTRRSGIPVNSAWMPLTIGNPERIQALNFVAQNLFHEWQGVRYDSFTVSGALEAMHHAAPRVLYVSMGETDDWAHAGRYDRYLLTTRQNDTFIRHLWETAQELPKYSGKTAFVLVTDHGRGDGREGWKGHGKDNPGSERIWVAAFGPGIAASGVDSGGRYTQSQVAATVAKLLGFDFTTHDPRVAKPLPIVQ